MERFDRRYANNLQGLMSSSLAEMGGTLTCTSLKNDVSV
jgi:hypothetical protein